MQDPESSMPSCSAGRVPFSAHCCLTGIQFSCSGGPVQLLLADLLTQQPAPPAKDVHTCFEQKHKATPGPACPCRAACWHAAKRSIHPQHSRVAEGVLTRAAFSSSYLCLSADTLLQVPCSLVQAVLESPRKQNMEKVLKASKERTRNAITPPPASPQRRKHQQHLHFKEASVSSSCQERN